MTDPNLQEVLERGREAVEHEKLVGRFAPGGGDDWRKLHTDLCAFDTAEGSGQGRHVANTGIVLFVAKLFKRPPGH